MKVLLLGGYGYIGSVLYTTLVKNNISVDKYGSRTQDYNKLTNEFLNQYTDIVVLAGHSSVPSCNGPLNGPWNNNVRNFSNLIKKLNPTVRVIYASSSSVYGTTGKTNSTESDKSIEYLNNYDLTKSVLDEVAQNFIYTGRPIVGLRFGTVCGASPVLRTDILLNSMVKSALHNKIINVTNPNIHRPFLDIEDLTKSILVILENFVPGIYNLASENNTIMSYARMVATVTNAKVQNNGNTNGVYDFSIDCTKFKDTFGILYSTGVFTTVDKILQAMQDPKTQLVSRTEYFEYKS